MEDKQTQRISIFKKNANKKQWYKDKADLLDVESNSLDDEYGRPYNKKRIKVNYDLFNDILDVSDFEYVCNPYGSKIGELPAKMVNRDIISSKIKVLLGMEMVRPFSWKIIATNEEATTRKEQEEFSRIKEYVTNQIMLPIRQNIELKYQEQLQNKTLSEDEKNKIIQTIEEETKSQTPDEVKLYMKREHQDPAEVMATQLLEYLNKKCDLKNKFNLAFKHGLISARQIMYIGILNNEPEAWNVNSLRFNYDKSPDNQFVEDGEWASCEHRMTPSDIIKYFGDKLTQKEIDIIYQSWSVHKTRDNDEDIFDEDYGNYKDNTIKVIHCTWKSLRKIGFLTFLDENGQEQQLLVDETYVINKDTNDIKIEWEWLPEVYETWKIKAIKDIYVNMRPIPGQFKDLDNLYHCKLPYYGIIYDNLNSEETSVVDRLKPYAYFRNIILYRLELILASDKGKKTMLNINSIPNEFDREKWLYFFESNGIGFFNPNENGTDYRDANNVAKVIDLSTASDIQKYIELAEYLKKQAGLSVGITEQMEGQIAHNEAVRNAQQSIVQSSYVVESYFDYHNIFKKNVLTGLLEIAKIAYSGTDKKKISYVLDDLSMQILNLNTGLLDNSTFGLFISNSSESEQLRNNIRQLAHAAVQNQKIELSDVVKVLTEKDITRMEEQLEVAEDKRRNYENKMQMQQMQMQQEEGEKQRQQEKEKFKHEEDIIRLKGEEERKTETLKQSLIAASFNPDQDKDKNGVNDFIEIAKHGLNEETIKNKQALEKEKFEHQKQTDKEKIRQTDEKIKNEKDRTKVMKQNKNN